MINVWTHIKLGSKRINWNWSIIW